MTKLLRWRFRQCFAPLALWLSKATFKRGFLDIYLNNSFALHNFQNIWPMSVAFSFKMFKNLFRFQKNSKKLRRRKFFLDNFNWIGSKKSSLVRREYLSWAVNMLTNSPNSSHLSNRDIFQLKFPQSDKKIW